MSTFAGAIGIFIFVWGVFVMPYLVARHVFAAIEWASRRIGKWSSR